MKQYNVVVTRHFKEIWCYHHVELIQERTWVQLNNYWKRNNVFCFTKACCKGSSIQGIKNPLVGRGVGSLIRFFSLHWYVVAKPVFFPHIKHLVFFLTGNSWGGGCGFVFTGGRWWECEGESKIEKTMPSIQHILNIVIK